MKKTEEGDLGKKFIAIRERNKTSSAPNTKPVKDSLGSWNLKAEEPL